MGMRKMSDTQRYTVLSYNDAPANRGLLTAYRHSTIRALVANGWAFYPAEWPKSTWKVARSAYVTSQGLRAAGFDMDALHTVALAENEACGCLRNPLGHSRDEHSSLYWEAVTEGMPRVPAW
jgi:hypothetical protein